MAGRKVITSNPAVAVALVALLVAATASGATELCKVDTDRVKAECSSYCTVGSTEAAPKEGCCKAVEHANFSCLCHYKSLLKSGGIDPDRAMQIPSKCHIPGAPASC